MKIDVAASKLGANLRHSEERIEIRGLEVAVLRRVPLLLIPDRFLPRSRRTQKRLRYLTLAPLRRGAVLVASLHSQPSDEAAAPSIALQQCWERERGLYIPVGDFKNWNV